MAVRIGLVGAALLASAVLPLRMAAAAGFYLQEENAAGVARAQAGSAATADDASTLYFNPAGMTELPGLQAAGAIDLILPSDKLTDQGTIDHSLGALLANPASGGNSPAGGSNGGDPGSPAPVANFYATYQIPTTDLTVGIGMSTPFGLAAKYRADSFARYDSIDGFLETIEIEPSIAWKVTEWLSLGAGLDEQYAYVKLRQALPDPLNLGGPTPQTDGRLTLTGHTWSTGFNIGILLKPLAGTKIGFAYRYGIRHNIDQGTVTVSGMSGPLAVINGQYRGVSALDLPDVYDLGFSQRLTPELTLLGQVDYYAWSNFSAIAIGLNPPLPGTPSLVTPENYRDTFAVSIGAEYQLTDQLKLRSGLKYDQTPTVDAFRDTRVPDGDRIWLGGGVHYSLTDHLGIDVSYSHVFLANDSINVVRSYYPAPVTTTSSVKAFSEPNIDVLALGFTYQY